MFAWVVRVDAFSPFPDLNRLDTGRGGGLSADRKEMSFSFASRFSMIDSTRAAGGVLRIGRLGDQSESVEAYDE